MSHMDHGLQLLNLTRRFFKGSLKSTNKRYSLSYGIRPLANKLRGRQRLALADRLMAHQRDFIVTREEQFAYMSGMPVEYRTGNCCEYCDIAISYGIRMAIPNIWDVSNEMHIFLLLADIAEHELAGLTLPKFSRFEKRGFCVCDPWMNVVCPMENYSGDALLQCTKWKIEGKEIWSPISDDFGEALLWFHQFSASVTAFKKGTDGQGRSIND